MNPSLKCSCCEKPLTGTYYIDFWGNRVHAWHKGRTSQCVFCGRFISPSLTKGGHRMDDGSFSCSLCSSTAVKDNNTGKRYLTGVKKSLEKKGIIIDPFRPELALVSAKVLRGFGGDTRGVARYERKVARGEVKEFSMKIYIQKELPLVHFMAVAAHELMHIWFYSRNITDRKPLLLEGSCNVASFLILKDIKSRYSEYVIHTMMNSRNRVYGKGFRKMYRLYRELGIYSWLDYIVKHKSPPLLPFGLV